ncbi:hypothetical protein [Xenorhabdus griffiniae]|nr:hypothetical protein [Xenorhabdus griffiniae]KLU16088.1 hypothetical protein AAY47_07265 [Xenorhabdus griffiniae]KOP35142.1 hypothetical protein AFK69_00890 [Xenorhabdus sp. GDc328]
MMDSPEKILYKEYGSQGGEDHLINSRSLKGRASIAVHLRTFGSRYHWTPNPPSDDESFPVLHITGYSYNRAKQPLPYVKRYRFHRYNIHPHFQFITINVTKMARRHLCWREAMSK